MLRTVTSPFTFQFGRAGGAIITARADVWQAGQNGWVHMKEFLFSDPTSSTEQLQETLPVGSYTCVFKCYVEESLNGVYDFDFLVDGQPTYTDAGDVNTTAAKDDTKVYKDQFILDVQ